VEDNPFNQLLAQRVLHKMNATVDIAGNGKIAIEKMNAGGYDIILMDIQMPEMDGYEATRHIRTQLPDGPNKIPIIAMTAHALVDEGSKCILAGMNDYISKPFDPQVLGKKIKDLVTGSKKNSAEANPDAALTNDEEKKKESLSLSVLKELLGDSNDVLLEVLETLNKELPAQTQNVRLSAEQKNWKQLGRDAHKMRSCVMMLGMPQFLSAVELLEKRADQENTPETLPALAEQVCSMSFQALSDLKRELLKLQAGSADSDDLSSRQVA
jgi:CheY-like chemotaxis protein